MADGALSDVVVLELTTGVAGGYCGRLLADLGAQVIKVEPLEGDPVRREEPIVNGESAFFAWLNAGKLGLALPINDARIASLVVHADIVLHDGRWSWRRFASAAAVLDARRTRAGDNRVTLPNPATVAISLTPYGLSGPRAGWQASTLTEYATGGYHYFGGDPQREPIALPGHQVEFHAGLHAGIAALAGLWHGRETGEGQLIEISHQDAMLSDHSWLATMWNYAGQVQRRAGSTYVKCADGYTYLFPLAPYPNLLVLIERFDLLEDASLQTPLGWRERLPEIMAAFSEWAATRTKQEIYHAAQELRIAMSPVNTMADVAASTQLKARDWFREIEAGGGSFQAPGVPYRLTGTPCRTATRAPALGEHTAEVLSPSFAWANAAVARPAQAANAGGATTNGPPPAPPPLTGLRVIEVTANWAGPIGGRHLADLGAEVIKVELQTKPATRALIYVGDDLWPEHYHRAGYFNKLNRNKKAICLDLSKAAGREVFLKLVAKADAVIENNASRVMNQLGLGYETLAEVNPGLVMCSMSGYGASGPETNYSAYGSNIETVSGLSSLLGYEPGHFYGTGSFYADPVTGNHGAVAVLAALHARRRTGRGQWIDMALLEAVAPFFGQEFLEYTVAGRLPEPMGNRSDLYSPQDVYRTAGSDCWLALTVRDTRDWETLCGVIGRSDLARDRALATLEGRRARAAEIDEAIGGWAATRDHLRAADELQAAGVPAAPVMANWEIVCDNHLNDRGFFVAVRHPRAGTHHFPGFPWRFGRTPAAIRCHAPLFAEHNHEVFEGLLGLSGTEVAALYAEGATADAPVYAAGPSL